MKDYSPSCGINILYTHPLFIPQLEKDSIVEKIENHIGDKKPVYFYNRILNLMIEDPEDDIELTLLARGITMAHFDMVFPSSEHIYINPFGLSFLSDRNMLLNFIANNDDSHLYVFDYLNMSYEDFLNCYASSSGEYSNDMLMDEEKWEETNKELENFVKELNSLVPSNPTVNISTH